MGQPGDAGLPIPSRRVLGMWVDAASYATAVSQIVDWARARESRYVCVASVNNVMQSRDEPPFRRVMREADLVIPDGRPLVWGLRALGVRGASQVRGTYLVEALLDRLATEGIPVGLYGAAPHVLEDLRGTVHTRWPGLAIAYAWSPPFRPLTPEEDEEVVARLADSPAAVLLVGMSTPKQDEWMSAHRGRVPAVMVGVGAAFDFLSGHKRQAPRLLQHLGLEWAFRLATEPRRLARRYLTQNPRFVVLFGTQLLKTYVQPQLNRRAGAVMPSQET